MLMKGVGSSTASQIYEGMQISDFFIDFCLICIYCLLYYHLQIHSIAMHPPLQHPSLILPILFQGLSGADRQVVILHCQTCSLGI